MTLIKTSILTSISTTIKIITSFIVVKIISVYLGPTGLALIAQIQNFTNMVNSLSSNGITTGVVKYTAEYKKDKKLKIKIWGNSVKISLFLTILIAIFIAMFSNYLSKILLDSEEYGFVFLFFSLSSIFFALNGIFSSILNGEGFIKKLTILRIVSAILSAIITVLLVIFFSLKGALISLFVSEFFMFFVVLFLIFKENWFTINIFFQKLEKEIIVKFAKYSSMVIVSAILNMSALIFLRNYIGTNLGWDSAGYWQGVWKISETYLMLITGTLSVYYLPKLSSLLNKKELHEEVKYVYKVVMPIVIIMALVIYILRDFIIELIFSKDFMPMSELFLYQLLGDIFKIASWLLGFILIAKEKILFFIVNEILIVFLFVFLSVLLISKIGLVGITQAFMIIYIINLLVLFIFYKKYILQ